MTQEQENISISVENKIYQIRFINKKDLNCMTCNDMAIIASGPSIKQVDFTQLYHKPCIFVNGSISLLENNKVDNFLGYVISDARFINHGKDILRNYFSGQPLYITQPVLLAIAKICPEIIQRYHQHIKIIEPAIARFQRIQLKNKINWLTKIILINKRKILNKLPNIILDQNNDRQIIGVSLDISNGFIEAGTVAFIAAQLAFSMGTRNIHLYGIDLLNANTQPRFYENIKNKAPIMLDKAIQNRIIPSFNWMAQVYRQHQVEVINHSPISSHILTSLINEY